MAGSGEDVTRAELLAAYRYWVSEASAAVRYIAFVEGYESVRKEYIAWCAREGIEPVHQALVPQSRALLPLLETAVQSLALFLTKGFDGKSTYGLLTLKNKTRYHLQAADDDSWTKIRDETKVFLKEYNKIQPAVGNYRNRFVAHADDWAVLGKAKLDLTPLKLISVANTAISLITLYSNLSGLKPIGTVDAPAMSDNSLVVASRKVAVIDSETLWGLQFASWAPGFSIGPDN